MKKVSKNRNEKHAEPRTSNYILDRLLTLPDIQEPNSHRRVPSFSLPRNRKEGRNTLKLDKQNTYHQN
jgi:hypothetical protein